MGIAKLVARLDFFSKGSSLMQVGFAGALPVVQKQEGISFWGCAKGTTCHPAATKQEKRKQKYRENNHLYRDSVVFNIYELKKLHALNPNKGLK